MSLEIEIPDGYELVGVYTTEEQAEADKRWTHGWWLRRDDCHVFAVGWKRFTPSDVLSAAHDLYDKAAVRWGDRGVRFSVGRRDYVATPTSSGLLVEYRERGELKQDSFSKAIENALESELWARRHREGKR